MQYKDPVRILRDVEHAVLGLSMNTDLNYSTPDTRHRTVIIRVQPELNQVQLVSGFASSIRREPAKDLLRPAYPLQVFTHSPILYKYLYNINWLPTAAQHPVKPTGPRIGPFCTLPLLH